MLKLKSAYLRSITQNEHAKPNSFDRYREQMNTNDEAVIDIEQGRVKLIMLIIGVTQLHS